MTEYHELSLTGTELNRELYKLILAYEAGTATGGGYDLVEDSSKSWTENEWSGYTAFLKTSHGNYAVEIISNAADGFTFEPAVDAATPATATIDADTEPGILTVDCIGVLEGIAGNGVEIILEHGTTDTGNDYIVWDGTAKTLTITVDSSGTGAQRVIQTGNIETLINNDMTASLLFTATMTNAGDLIAGTYTASGGADGNMADGDFYIQKIPSSDLVLETDIKTTDYSPVIGDESKIITMNKTGVATLTIPTDANATFRIGTVIGVYNMSADAVTITGAAGVFVRNEGNLEQYGEVSLRKRATDEWVLAGAVL